MNKVDINALVSLQMCGAAEMLKKYIDIEKDHFKNDNLGETLNSIRHYAKLLIDERNDVLHRHYMHTQSIRPATAFSYLCQYVDAVYGDNSMEHQYFTGTYSRDSSALTELLEHYLSAAFDNSVTVSHNTYRKQIRRIARSYTKLMQRKQYPHISVFVDIAICPKCHNHAFLIKRTEAIATYWTGEPNNSVSVLELFNPSGESEETLRCSVCRLEWKDDVLRLYQDIGKIKCIKSDIHPNDLGHEFRSYLACM